MVHAERSGGSFIKKYQLAVRWFCWTTEELSWLWLCHLKVLVVPHHCLLLPAGDTGEASLEVSRATSGIQ